MAVAQREEIRSFLTQVKILLEDDENYTFRSDLPKNKATLIKLGFTPGQALQEIKVLTYADYSNGPEDGKSKDGHKQGKIWVFGKVVCGLEIYIKIQLVTYKGFSKAAIISFHEAEFPLVYPYKNK